MASEMSREEAAALYAEKVRELNPDQATEARLQEYQRDVERRSSGR